MLKIEQREIYQNVGREIQRFAYEKFGKIKDLAKVLEIPPAYLSQIIHGIRQPSKKVIFKLTSYGFNPEIFSYYIGVKHQADVNNLTRSELMTMVKEYKEIVKQKERVIQILNDTINMYERGRKELSKEVAKQKTLAKTSNMNRN